ncbi:MAG: hypothetical protein AB7G11_06735 [Phycisphaerales bacterium]
MGEFSLVHGRIATNSILIPSNSHSKPRATGVTAVSWAHSRAHQRSKNQSGPTVKVGPAVGCGVPMARATPPAGSSGSLRLKGRLEGGKNDYFFFEAFLEAFLADFFAAFFAFLAMGFSSNS